MLRDKLSPGTKPGFLKSEGFSDLRNPGLVPGESLSLSTKFNSVLEENQTYIKHYGFHYAFYRGFVNIAWFFSRVFIKIQGFSK